MKPVRWAAAAVLAAVAAAPAAPADPSSGAPAPAATPTVVIPRVEGPLEVDGVLDEPVWGQAAVLDGFHQFQPVDGRKAEERTEVRLLYTAAALYFGVRAHDSQPATVRASVADRDSLSGDDTVTIYLDTFNDRRRAFFFTVNPLGAQADGVRTEGTTNPSEIDGGDIDGNPDFVFESRGRLTPEGWEVELRVPFRSLRYPTGPGSHTWGLNVERRVQRTGYVDTWTDVRRGSASFLAQSGQLVGLRDLQRGVALEAQPFATFVANGQRRLQGGFTRDAGEADAGINLRLGLASDTSLDATVNPDFSQVESDVGQVTINERFALYFPEKRPFFLEGIDLFSTPNRLIYTRRVVTPSLGGKLTFKRGKLNLAQLVALDESSVASVSDAWLSATRVRRDLGDDSTAGLTFTHRRQGDARNTVLAGDARWVFDKLYFIRAQGGGSWTDHGRGVPRVGAPLWLAEFDRTGRTWGFNYKVNAVGRGFDAQAGFVPRSDVVEANASNRVSVYGARGDLAESFSVYHAFTRRWEYSAFEFGAPLEEENSLVTILDLRGGWQIWTQTTRGSFRLDPLRYQGYASLTPEGSVPFVPQRAIDDLWSFLGRVHLPSYRHLDGSLTVESRGVPLFEEASRGRDLRVTASTNLRPTPSLRLGASLVAAWLTRARDGSEFARTLLPRLSVHYQPTRSFFVRVISEYRSERTTTLADPSGRPLEIGGIAPPSTRSSRLRLDALLSFEPTPGTVAFAGYGTTLGNARGAGLSDLHRLNDGFFFKLAYRFRN
jgi:hypothetical protein